MAFKVIKAVSIYTEPSYSLYGSCPLISIAFTTKAKDTKVMKNGIENKNL